MLLIYMCGNGDIATGSFQSFLLVALDTIAAYLSVGRGPGFEQKVAAFTQEAVSLAHEAARNKFYPDKYA